MKCFLFVPLILGLATSIQARPSGVKPALKVGECTKATFNKLRTRWQDEQHDNRAIIFIAHASASSPLALYLGYDLEKHKNRYWDYLGTGRPIDIEDAREMYSAFAGLFGTLFSS